MIEKVVGCSLEFVEDDAFSEAHFLKEINLKNVKHIGNNSFEET